MKKPKLTRAEQLARHRQIFLLARERGVSLIEAEQLLAREEWQAQRDRLAATRRCGRAIETVRAIGGSEPPLRPIGQALRSFESGLRLLPSGTAALLRAPLSLGQTLVGLVGAVSALSAQPRARLRAVEPLARFGGDIDAVVGTTPARRRQAANQDAIIHLVRAAAGAELVKAAAQIRWTNQSDATMTRNRIAAIFDAHALSAADAGEDARADQFDRLRTALARDIGARSAGLARGYRYTPRATEPALTIAQRLHGFGPAMEAQADALVAMNRVRHPGFVRGGSALDIVGSEPRNG